MNFRLRLCPPHFFFIARTDSLSVKTSMKNVVTHKGFSDTQNVGYFQMMYQINLAIQYIEKVPLNPRTNETQTRDYTACSGLYHRLPCFIIQHNNLESGPN